MITIMLTNQNYDEIQEKLGEIIAKMGPYKMDPHDHAVSVIDSNTKNAERIRDLLRSMIVEKTQLTSDSRLKEETP